MLRPNKRGSEQPVCAVGDNQRAGCGPGICTYELEDASVAEAVAVVVSVSVVVSVVSASVIGPLVPSSAELVTKCDAATIRSKSSSMRCLIMAICVAKETITICFVPGTCAQ